MKQQTGWLSTRIVATLGCLALAMSAFASPARAHDPVEELRRVIAAGGPTEDSPEALEFRRSKIRELAEQMKTIGQLRRALVLDEWKVDPDRVVNEGVRVVDTEMRKMIGERLKAALEKTAAEGSANARLAVANTIAEMGPTVRAIEPLEKGGFTRSLEPLVAKLSRDPDLAVRQEALRAIGNINAPPKDVADVVRKVFKDDPAVGPRRLAADGLQQMIKVVTHLQKRGQTATGVAANRKDLVDVLQHIAPVAALGVKDPDPEVRMLSLQSVQAAAQALAELLEVPEGLGRRNFPPPGRVLNAAERGRILDAYRQAEQDLILVKPMIEAIRTSVPVYAEGLFDAEPSVRLAAVRAFENLGNARLRLVRRAQNLPALRDAKDGIDRSPNDLLKEADFLQPVLDREMSQVIVLLRDPDVRIRRSTAEALEVLEEKAEPAMPGLIAALGDPDRFVRWTAAKTLGYMPPGRAGPAVLPLSALLSDPDLSLRIAAAASLEALGPVAAPAVPALAKAIRAGDVEARLAAMYALMKVGAVPAQAAVPALIESLNASDPKVVKTACEVIAEIGPPAAAALPALRRLVGHDDPEVRIWASEAILSILRVPEA